MMDDNSPEPTVILKSLKDLNKFINGGKTTSSSWTTLGNTPRGRLNFSIAEEEDDEYSEDYADRGRKRKATSDFGSQFIKKHRDNVTGLGKYLVFT